MAGLVVVFFLFLIAAAKADFTGSQLKNVCRAYPNGPNMAICFGYIVGARDAWRGAGRLWESRIKFCQPTNATNDQVIAAVNKYLEDNSGELQTSATELILSALAETYPCSTP
jgi:hypothetical protein